MLNASEIDVRPAKTECFKNLVQIRFLCDRILPACPEGLP
jgi:hypothetical protein